MDFAKNPFAESDSDRHQIWAMLVERDIDAFLSCDWSMHGPEFDAESFFGLHAHKSELPDSWHEERIGDAYRFTRKPKDVRYADYATIPFVSMNLIPQGGVLTPSFKEKQPNEISSGTYFEKGDLLLSKITPSFENGKQAIASNLRPHLVSPLPK